MLLTGWSKEITRAECRPEAQTVHCIARLHENIAEVIPYLNAVLGGHPARGDSGARGIPSAG